jgi:hypothetical protein
MIDRTKHQHSFQHMYHRPETPDVWFRRNAMLVLVLAFVLRLVWGVVIPVVPVSDSAAYDALAQTLATYGVYGWQPEQPSAYWPVGTSALYAFFFHLFGHQYPPIVLLHIALGTAIVGMTMLLGRDLFNERIGVIAGWLVALCPTQVFFTTVLASELPFTLLVIMGMYLWFNGGLRFAALSGFALGLASLIRPVSLLLPLVFWVSSAGKGTWKIDGLKAFVALTIIFVTIAPWALRNTKVFGEFVMISTNGGANLWMGNNPDSQGEYMPLPKSVSSLNESDRDRVLGEQAKNYIITNPGLFILRSLKKAVALHKSETIGVHWNSKGITERFGEKLLFPLKLLTQAYWMLMIGSAVVGIIILTRAFGLLALVDPIILVCGYFTLVYAVTVIQDRYHIPSHPFIGILASIAICRIIWPNRPAVTTI